MTDKHEKWTETFERWLSDGESWIGVFENHDLGHPDAGRRVAFCFDVDDWDKGTTTTHAPDHKEIGLGWRYLLISKHRTVEGALKAMTEDRCDISLAG